MKLGQNVTMQVDAISTGSLSLDLALGIGGLPRGRVVEIYGPESSGKTTAGPAHASPRPRRGAARRPSSTWSTRWTRCTPGALGVDIDALLVSQPDTGEQALEICEALVRSGAIDVVVIDSVAAMVPQVPRSRAKWATPMWACRPA